MKHVANPFLISFSVLLLCSPQLVSAGFFEDLSNTVTSGLEKAGEFIEDKLPPVEQKSPDQEGTGSISGKSTQENQVTAQPSGTVEPIKEPRASEKRASLSRSEIKEIQKRLNQMGYSTGTPDGLPGKKTKKAIAAYQADNDLQIDGVPSLEVLGGLKRNQYGPHHHQKVISRSPARTSQDIKKVEGNETRVTTNKSDIAIQHRLASGRNGTFAIASDGSLVGWGGGFPGNGTTTLFPENVKLSHIVYAKSKKRKTAQKFIGVERSGTVVDLNGRAVNNRGYRVKRRVKKRTAIKVYPVNGIVGITKNLRLITKSGKIYDEEIRDIESVVDYIDNGKGISALKSDGTVWVPSSRSKNSWKWKRLKELPLLRSIEADVRHKYGPWGISRNGNLIQWSNRARNKGKDGKRHREVKLIMNDVVQYAVGEKHKMILKSNGTVWAWGKNNMVQLGDGTDIDRNSPVQVIGLDDVVAIAAGDAHSVAIKSDGSVWTWGVIGKSQIENGGGHASSVPVRVKGVGGIGYLNLNNFDMAAVKAKVEETKQAQAEEKTVKAAKEEEVRIEKAEKDKAKAEKEKIDTECKKLASLVANRNPSRSRDFSKMNFSVCVSKHGLDLRGADLSGASLGGAQLDRMDLSKADLSDSNLNNASLVGSNLRGADLSSAKFRNANLSRADLSGSVANKAMFQKAILVDAKLRNADLSAAYFSRADVSGADFTGARITDRRRLNKAKNIDEAIGIKGDARSSGYTQQSTASSSLPQDNSSLAQQFQNYLGGKRIDYKYNAPGQGPSMDITAFACKNGEFILKNNSAMSGGSGVNIGGSPSIRSGRWNIFTQGGKGFLIVNYADGQQETYELLVQNGTTYFNGDRVNVSDKNTFCP